MIYLDAHMIDTWLRCREEFRQRFIENREPGHGQIHLIFGGAVHEAVELLWKGHSFGEALHEAQLAMRDEEPTIHPNDRRKWEELNNILPDVVACYADNARIDPPSLLQLSPPVGFGPVQGEQPALEYQFEWPHYVPGHIDIRLVGRIDRVEVGPKLIDVKTASEMDGEDCFRHKVGFEKKWKEDHVKDVQIALYDFVLRQIGMVPREIEFEVVTKPSERYRRKARFIRIPVPEVIAYRDRFDMLLEVTIQDIVRYIQTYRQMSPWPMTTSACPGRYNSRCPFDALCLYGMGPKIEKLYRPRREHLELKEARIGL